MKELEKFNAETTPPGTLLITRDGREVSEWYYFKTLTGEFKVHAVVNGVRFGYTENGKPNIPETETILDLFIKPKVKECWVNVYMGKNGELWLGHIFNTKQQAIDNKANVLDYIKTIRITDEVEQS